MRIFKEITLSILILIVILITMGVVLYDKIPSLKKIPNAQEYSNSAEATSILEEVVNEETSVAAVKTYNMDKKEINSLSSRAKFEKGKKNPFADYTTPSSETTSNNSTSGTTNSSSGTTSPSTSPSTSENDATSGGKIFDNKEDGISK